MEAKVTFFNGKKRVTLRIHASGIDKTREAALAVMGPGYEYKDTSKKSK